MPRGDMPPDLRQIAELQQRAARAVPAAVQDDRGGCWLRYTDSTTTWWAGATLVHGVEGTGRPETPIAVAEDFYAALGAPARFQVCPACPPELDNALSVRGYESAGVMSLHVADVRHVAGRLPSPPLRVDVTSRPDQDWFRLWTTVHAPDADPAPEWRLLHRVDGRSAYVTVFGSGQQPVAVGRAVADTSWVGIFGMATLPAARRQGAARRVLVALAEWAIDQETSGLYLQVEADNHAAVGLYRSAGFDEVCVYHYRVAAEVAPI
jgi:N-acetylglutamate synthase